MRFSALLTGLLICAAGASGCSPDVLGGSNQSSLPTYTPVNTNCENMDLSSPTFDVTAWRVMIKCLNSYGALQPIEALNEKLSDSDLKPVVTAVSTYLLKQPKTLYEIQQSYNSLESAGGLDPLFQNLGAVLSNDQFVVSAVKLMKAAYETNSSSFLGLVHTSQADPNFLAALQYLAPKITPANVATGIDVGMTAVTAPSFASLQKRLQPSSPDGQSLEGLTGDVLEYIQPSASDPNPVPVGAEALQGLISGDLFRALDDAIGGSSVANLQSGIDRLSSVFRAVSSPGTSGGEDLLSGIATLFNAMNQPLSCLDGTQSVADGDMFILSQLVQQPDSSVANYLEVSNPLLLITVNPFCQYPPQLAQDYAAMIQFAETSAMVPGADLVKALYRPVVQDPAQGQGQETRPLATWFVDMMAESSIQDVVPVMSELNTRGIWDDVLLLATIPPVEDRPSIASALQYLMNPIPGTSNGTSNAAGNASIYDVFLNSARRVKPIDFYDFVESLNTFVDSDQPVFQPLLQSARDFYYLNDAHPFTGLVQSFLQDAQSNSAVFATLFKAAEMPEFQQSIQLLARMAKDGQLKQLSDTMLALIAREAQNGATTINPVTEPAFAPLSRHDLDETNLTAYALTTTPLAPTDPCANLDLSFEVNQFSSANYNQAVNNISQCLANDLGDPSVASTISFLESQTSQIGGLNYFQLPIQIIQNMNLTQGELSYMSNAWITNYDSGFFLDLLDVVPYFITQTVGPADGGNAFAAGPVLQPLFSLAAPLMSADAQPKLDAIESYAATELQRSDFPQTLGFADKLLNETNEPVATPVSTDFDMNELKRWVEAKECDTVTTPAQVDQRASQIIDDFDNAVNNWSLQNGEPKRSWSFPEFQSGLAGTFKKLANPSLNAPDESLTQAMLNVLSHFALAPGQAPNPTQHFQPVDLANFFKQRSEDYRLITYYYQDENGNFEKYPRVKLVNTLDRLELVMLASNFDVSVLGLKLIGNSSLQYGMELALAWGDTPREQWPPKIQAMFPPGATVQTIQDVVSNMDQAEAEAADIVGYPSLPQCAQPTGPYPNDPPPWPKNNTGVHMPEIGVFYNVERSLFNDNQVLSVMSENSPAATGPNAGGLKILRDLFYELYFSTPTADRSTTLGESGNWMNNVNVSIELSQMGMMRVLGQRLRAFTGNEQDLLDVFRTLTNAGSYPQTLDALNALMSGGTHPPAQPQEAFWSAVQSIFNVFDSAEGVYTPAEQAELAAMTPTQQQAQEQEWVREAARMKQLGYYALALGDDPNLASASTPALTPAMMGAVAQAVGGYSDFLTQNADDIESVLRSQQLSYSLRGLYEEPNPQNQQLIAAILNRALSNANLVPDALGLLQDVANDPTAQSSWTLFTDRLDTLEALPEYQPYDQYLNTFGGDLVSFFSNQTTNANAISASNHIRNYAATLLTQGDVDQFLLLAKNNPNESYQVLQTISRYIQNGDLQNFFQLVRQSLSQPVPGR